MLLTITYTGQNAADLGYLLYKNPYRPQVFELNHGKAYVFYPEISDGKTTVALLLDINPMDLARGKPGSYGGGLYEYINDRPYTASSFLSTAVSRVFGTAMTGRADAHQSLSDARLNLTAAVTMLPCHGEPDKLDAVFKPLGYAVEYEVFYSDEHFPDWNSNKYVNLTIKGMVRLRDLLKHLYVLIPVFDNQKHYWVAEDEVDKLLRMGEDWLPGHPEKMYITSGYLKRRRSLVDMAVGRLAAEDGQTGEAYENDADGAEDEENPRLNLNARRYAGVVAALKNSGAKRVIDIGCGEGHLIKLLVTERQFTHIAGVDVSPAALIKAKKNLKLDSAADAAREKVNLFQGSVTYKDERFKGFDAACVVEVIEHLDVPRLDAFERVLFETAKPTVIIVTTPNRDYNINYHNLNENKRRHADHRFEWSGVEFKNWSVRVSKKYGYGVQFTDIGAGAPTQMGVFKINY